MTRCEACGAALGGTDACVAAMQQMLVEAQQDARHAAVYRLAFDAFCMQHPERHGVSAKSYAAHLTGLCHGLEHAGRPNTYWAIPAWLNHPRHLRKPPLLTNRGEMTINDVRGARSPEEHAERVRAWAASVWQAYAAQHEMARAWLREALGEKK